MVGVPALSSGITVVATRLDSRSKGSIEIPKTSRRGLVKIQQFLRFSKNFLRIFA